jgi:endonuclease/exonuclease/phosphatase family metal-dependent hydrolase
VTRALLSINCRLPAFIHPPESPADTSRRVRLLADIINHSGAEVVTTAEADRTFLARIAREAGSEWSYQRAQGPDGRGLNGVLWKGGWHDHDLRDWNLPSRNTWPRTCLLVRLIHDDGTDLWVGSTHFSPTSGDLPAVMANALKLEQVKLLDVQTKGKFYNLIVGADFPRTNDSDDLAYLRARGWTFAYRDSKTPQAVFHKKRVSTGPAQVIDTGQATDHPAVLVPFNIDRPVT